jgi:hypothetical protein
MYAIKKNPLSKLSDAQIIKRLDGLVHKERETTLEVLLHLIEMDQRSLYLARGYGSLYEYCTRRLGYSESGAGRRIKTARCIRDYPEIYEMLSKNELNLSIVCKLAGILNAENKQQLLKEARFQSVRQVDAIIARLRPLSIFRERVRPVYVRKGCAPPASNGDSTNNSKSSSKESDQKFTADAGGKKVDTCRRAHFSSSALEQKFKLEFAVSPEVMKKLEEARALLSKKYPRGVSFAKLFEVMLEEYLEEHSPKRKNSRRKKRIQCKKKSAGSKRTRHIPQAVQDGVFVRDEGKCTFVGPDGVRCSST